VHFVALTVARLWRGVEFASRVGNEREIEGKPMLVMALADRSARRRCGGGRELARMLVAAGAPAIVAGRVARTPVGLAHLTELAYYCHGTVGQGSIAGVRVAVLARNLQGFTRYVRQSSGAMPAYTDKILSDAELADMFAYLRALPPAKPASEIPLLEQLEAKP
jgi:cytochrome c553